MYDIIIYVVIFNSYVMYIYMAILKAIVKLIIHTYGWETPANTTFEVILCLYCIYTCMAILGAIVNQILYTWLLFLYIWPGVYSYLYAYRVAKMQRIPYFYRSSSAKEPLISGSCAERDLQLKAANMNLRYHVFLRPAASSAIQ